MELFGISFLFYFLPLFLGVYYITSEKNKPLTILLGSVIFYVLQDGIELWQVAVALMIVVVTFFIGLGMKKEKKRLLLLLGLILLGAVLVFLKCFRGGSYLPGGMSFYIFQMAAYLVDIHRGRTMPEDDLISYGAQMLMFPRLLSGPLAEPSQLQAQMAHPKVSQIRFRAGLQELVVGLCLKVLLADRLAGIWSRAQVIGFDSLSPAFAWLALIAFALRLYFDFHGYSMMAVGLGKLMGFELPRNFESPYAARSVSDFYRRWHITLTRWFRQYVYIPLGGNRKGKTRQVFNILAVWILTGLWHGVDGNYLLWGAFLGLVIAVEKLWFHDRLQRLGVGANLYTVFVVLLSWVPFAIRDMEQLVAFLSRLFGLGQTGAGELMPYLPLVLVGILFASPLPERIFLKFRERVWFDCALFILFWISIYFVSTTAQDPFMYFNF